MNDKIVPWRSMQDSPSSAGSRVIIKCKNNGSEDHSIGEAFLGIDNLWYWAGSDVGYHDPVNEQGDLCGWMPLPKA